LAQDFLTSASKALLEEAGWCYFDYSVTEDFRRLWALDAKAAAVGTAPARIAIDWRGAPPGPPGFPGATDFVTPIDWMFGRAYVMQGLGQTKPCEVLIIDRRPRMVAANFADEFRLALIDALPEMKVFSAFGGPTRDYVALESELRPPTAPVVPEQAVDTRDSSARSTAFRHSPARLAALRNAWLSYTVRSQDHHDLSNLLGPLALGEAPGGDASDGPSAVRVALYTMVDWLQLCEDRPRERATGWISGTAYERLADAAPIDAILVDDQAELGWARVVAGALGIADAPTVLSGSDAPTAVQHGTGRLYFTIAPADLLDALKNRLAPQDPFARRIPLPGGAEDQVVFLDLRLFPRRGVDERQFYVDLCREVLGSRLTPRWQHDDHFSSKVLTDRDRKILEPLVDDPEGLLPSDRGRAGLAFLTCASAILEDARISWQRIAESSLYDYLLTLLPRYVAQLLFTTPIVLFSATSRRDLVEHFREYGNIVTAFEKPHLPFRYEVVRRAFRHAVDEAARLVSARRALRSMAPTAALETPFLSGHFYHVDLFIDEAFPEEDQDYCQTGGFYAVFQGNSAEDVLQSSAQFDDALVEHGFCYFTRDPLPPSLPEGSCVKFKKNMATIELQAALEGSKGPMWYGAFRLGNDLRGDTSRQNSTGDDAYRRSLSSVVQSFLCEILPHASQAVTAHNQISVSIYAGERTRAWSVEHQVEAKGYQYRYGLYGFPTDDKYYLVSLDRGALQPIVDDIEVFRGIRFRIERALAIRITYDADQRDKPSYSRRDQWCICRRCRQPVPIQLADQPRVPNTDETFDRCVVVGIAGEKGPDWPLIPVDKGRQVEISQEAGGSSLVYLPEDIAPYGGISKGDLLDVKLESIQSRWRTRFIVTEARWASPAFRIVIRPRAGGVLICPVCGTDTALRPDFPGGIYVADNVLTLRRGRAKAFPPQEYAAFMGLGPLGFDATLTNGLALCRDAGQAADAGDLVGAARLVVRALGGEPEIRSCRLASRILGRLQPRFADMNGREFAAISAALSFDDVPGYRAAATVGQPIGANRGVVVHDDVGATSSAGEDPASMSRSRLIRQTEPMSLESWPMREVVAEPNITSEPAQPRSTEVVGLAGNAYAVTLSRFEFIMAASSSTGTAAQAIEATVRGALDAAGLIDPSIRLSSRLNGKRTAVVCDVLCSLQIAEWLCANKQPEVASAQPWWGAATDPVLVVQPG
jgi:hypothetical protein